MSKRGQKIDKNNLKTAYYLCLITAIGLTLVYVFQSFYPSFIGTFSNIFSPVIAGVAVISSFFALRRYWSNIRSWLSRIWLCFTLGMLLWFLGELGWAIYTLALNVEIPFPSIADAFWLIGYMPLFFALLLYVRFFKLAISAKMIFLAFVAIVCVSVVVFPLLMVPVLAEASKQDFVALVTSLAYPILDLLLFLAAVLGLLLFTTTRLKGPIGVAWIHMNAAILLNVLGDMSFSYTTFNGTYYNGHPQELLFLWGYLLFALAFYTHTKEL